MAMRPFLHRRSPGVYEQGHTVNTGKTLLLPLPGVAQVADDREAEAKEIIVKVICFV